MTAQITTTTGRRKPLDRVAGALRDIGRYLAWVSGAGTIALMFLTIADVTGRRLLSTSVPGAVEVAEVGLAAVVFLSMMAAELDNVHVRTPILVGRLKGRTAHAVRLAGLLPAVAFAALATVLTAQEAVSSTLRGEYRFGVVFVPIWPVRILIPIGLAGLTLALLAKAAARLVDLWHNNPVIDDTEAGMYA